ncbi:MAG: hypothetical protein II789_06610 [Clostridia bacterium]|nr:hypothetical protein [Clostridia bacterium]
MQYTSSEAAKILRRLNEEHDTLISQENLGSTFIVASGEDAESLRPEYDYEETQRALKENEAKVRQIKHALNVFNSTHKLPGYDITVDEALVLIPQLSARKARLGSMRANLPKTRERGIHTGGTIIDYRLTNYDPKDAQRDFEETSAELSAIQTALDLFNTTEKLELEL